MREMCAKSQHKLFFIQLVGHLIDAQGGKEEKQRSVDEAIVQS